MQDKDAGIEDYSVSNYKHFSFPIDIYKMLAIYALYLRHVFLGNSIVALSLLFDN
jgi:hypothetical protein